MLCLSHLRFLSGVKSMSFFFNRLAKSKMVLGLPKF